MEPCFSRDNPVRVANCDGEADSNLGSTTRALVHILTEGSMWSPALAGIIPLGSPSVKPASPHEYRSGDDLATRIEMHQDARKGMKRPLKLAAFGSGMAAGCESGGEFGGGGFHGEVFSLKVSRTPPITGRARAAFYRTWSSAERQRANRRARERGLRKTPGRCPRRGSSRWSCLERS